MNNQMMVERYAEKQEEEIGRKAARTTQQKAAAVRGILEALRMLKGNREFQVLQRMVFTPEIETHTKKLRNDRDQVEFYRSQGALKLADAVLDIDNLIRSHQNELLKLEDRIKGAKEGKEN